MLTFLVVVGLYLLIGMIWAWVILPALAPDFYAYPSPAGQIHPNSAKYALVLIWPLVAIVVFGSWHKSKIYASRKRRWGPLSAFNQRLNRKLNVYEGN